MKIGGSTPIFTRPPQRRLPTEVAPDEVPISTLDEGLELPVDLARRGQNLIVRVPIVGASVEDISVTVNQDILFIHKSATPPLTRMDTYYIRECHWGPIARELHLPLAVDPDGIQASLKDGVLTVTLPIIKSTSRTRVIKIR